MKMFIIGLMLIAIFLFTFSAIRISDESNKRETKKKKSRH